MIGRFGKKRQFDNSQDNDKNDESKNRLRREYENYQANRRDTISSRTRRQEVIKGFGKQLEKENTALNTGAKPALAGGSLYTRMYYPVTEKKKMVKR